MPREGKKLLVIIDNLEEFSDKSLSLISDESTDGCSRLIGMIEEAKNNYKRPIESWLKGWFYQYSRIRGPQVEHAIKGMESFPDAFTRLQEFKALVNKGEWNHGSFNYYLFVEIVKAIPGYEPINHELLHPVILRLKDLISYRIDSFMAQYSANQKLMKAREAERQHVHQSSQKSLENVQVLNHLDKAKQASKQQSQSVFCLSKTETMWEFSWVDFEGKVYKLEPSKELHQLLVSQKVDDVETLHPDEMKRVKAECEKARDLFLKSVNVLINPKDKVTHAPISNNALISKGAKATFIIRGKPQEYSLCWIDTLSQVKEISLEEYPKLKNWLDTIALITKDHKTELRAYLLHVNTKKELGMKEFKNDLMSCLSGGVKQPKSMKPFTEIEKPKRLDMSQFSELNRCIAAQLTKKEPVVEKIEKPVPGRLNVENFAVATLFGHKAKLREIVVADSENEHRVNIS